MNEKVLYKKSDIGYPIIGLAVLAVVISFIMNYSKNGEEQMSLEQLLSFCSIFFIVIILFYKLTIKITESTISASFGVGLINRKMKISDIDLSTIEEVKVNLWTGIGWRITPKGILYNVNTGKAIFFKSKNKKKHFFVGTKEYDTIKQILEKYAE